MPISNHIIQNRKGFYVSVDVKYIKDGDYIVSYCQALNLSSYGKTNKEAKEMFKEALNAFMTDIIGRDKLEVSLLELGWQLRKVPTPEYLPPATKATRKNFIGGYSEKILMPA